VHHDSRGRDGVSRQIALRTSSWLRCRVRPGGCRWAGSIGVASKWPGLRSVCRQHWRRLLQVLLGGRAVVIACACGPGASSLCVQCRWILQTRGLRTSAACRLHVCSTPTSWKQGRARCGRRETHLTCGREAALAWCQALGSRSRTAVRHASRRNTGHPVRRMVATPVISQSCGAFVSFWACPLHHPLIVCSNRFQVL
jgi:hypothetical protein